jgi:GTPase SAR1 family protein
LVGTKKDLRTDVNVIKELRKLKLKPIMLDEGLKVASRIGAVKYFETSAITKEGVSDLFDFAARIVINNRKTKKCIIL